MSELSRLLALRAELEHRLAEVDLQLGRAFEAAVSTVDAPDTVLSLAEAAQLMAEPPSTFRRRLEYRKALVSKEGERRLRYSRAVLDRIKRDRLQASAMLSH